MQCLYNIIIDLELVTFSKNLDDLLITEDRHFVMCKKQQWRFPKTNEAATKTF